MHFQFKESELQLRSKEAYKSHIADLDGPLHDHIATTYGVTEKSILNSSRYFHVIEGLVPDIMHNILEGTLQVSLKCLINYLIRDQKFFSLLTLNKRMSSFQFGSAEQKNKPSELCLSTFHTSDTLKQSGMYARKHP